MNGHLIRERDAAFERYDRALERWPARAGDDFVRELTAVVNEMERIATEADAADGDRLERGRTWRYAGDACVDRAADRDPTWLAHARRDYQQAEERLEGLKEPLQRGKLDFNIGSLLRLLSGGRDRRLLDDAERRMSLAMAAFQKDAPDLAQRASDALGVIKAQAALAALSDEATEGKERLERIEQAFATPVGREKRKEILAGLQVGPDTMAVPEAVGKFTATGLEAEIASMRQMLQQGLKSGEVRAERASALNRLLDKLESLQGDYSSGKISAEQANARVKQLFGDLAPLLADPGPQERRSAAMAAGLSRAATVDTYVGQMKVAITREMLDVPPAATREALGGVLGDLVRFQNEMQAGVDDAAVAEQEANLLRPAARGYHQLSMTRHLLLARPLWECVDYVPAVNSLFFAGQDDLKKVLEAVAARKQLTVENTERIQNHGQVRWDTLNRCHVGVFDLRGADGDMAQLAAQKPKQARALAAVAYELGMAFATGRPVVVVAGIEEQLPFDVDIAPVALSGDAGDDAAALAQAIDEAFYLPQRSGRSSSLGTSLQFLDRLTANHKRRTAFDGMGWLAPELASDPAGFVAACEQLLRAMPQQGLRILRPSWPGAYPEAGRKQCFHVMPFGPAWANEVRDTARAVCDSLGLVYRRGDEADEGRIIHAIWDDICRAHVVLVDLTGANLNVMIELGIAHALGRPVQAVQRSDTVGVRPKNVEKLRVLRYADSGELKSLLQQRLAVASALGGASV